MTFKEKEYAIDVIVNQVIFMNAIGEIEYHPERMDMLFGYFYMKYFQDYKFNEEYNFDFDMGSLSYYEDIKDVVSNVKIEACDIAEWSTLKSNVLDKIEFKKNSYLKKDNYSLTDAYLSGLINKLTEWIDDKGIDKFMTVLSKTGEEIGN